MNLTDWLVIAVLFIAAFTRSALGFGDALLAMPLLALVLGFQTATPLVAFVGSTIALSILLGSWRSIELKAAWRLIVATLLGIPIGLWLLKGAPEDLVKGLLGGLMILYGFYNLVKLPLPNLPRPAFAYLFGFFAGILGGAYNTSGPPIVVYGTMRGWPPERFRATLQGYFFPTGLLILIGHGLAGLWTPTVFRLYAFSLPAVLLAVFLGGLLNRYIPSQRFATGVQFVLILMGLLLLIDP